MNFELDFRLLVDSEPVDSAEFSPDGARILTASEDGTAVLWEAGTGRKLASLPHRGSVLHATHDSRGRWVATASADGGTLRAPTSRRRPSTPR